LHQIWKKDAKRLVLWWLSDVREAAAKAKELVAGGQVRPLRGLIANAGVMVKDTRTASADGYELIFVNYLARA
jgi:hypothetical protein